MALGEITPHLDLNQRSMLVVLEYYWPIEQSMRLIRWINYAPLNGQFVL